jgi:hypothetical protein
LYLEVSTITDKLSLVRHQYILYMNRGMMWLKSPLVSPQEIGIFDILLGFQPNAFFYQDLVGRNSESNERDQPNRSSPTSVIPVANACSAVSRVWRNSISRYSIVSKALISTSKPSIHKWNTWQ